MPDRDLTRASTLDLTCELTRRVIERETGAVDPVLGMLRLACTMGSMLNVQQRHRIASVLRDQADALELREHAKV